MSEFSARLALCCVITLLATPALAQQSAQPTPAGPADKAFSAEMKNMSHTMSTTPMTGNADQDFVTMMLPHHMAAVAMAKTELHYGKDPVLRKMAHNIITSQDQEISEMRAWQAAHPKP